MDRDSLTPAVCEMVPERLGKSYGTDSYCRRLRSRERGGRMFDHIVIQTRPARSFDFDRMVTVSHCPLLQPEQRPHWVRICPRKQGRCAYLCTSGRKKW